METLADLPKGPLDVYRKRASFNWKSLKVHLEGEEHVRLQVKDLKFIKLILEIKIFLIHF